ncbi:MAG: type I phosphomannose isomerase catalytic subunit [Bacteroidales bacterium]
MNTLYPLKFRPVFKDKIWGGDKIKKMFGKDFSPLPNCGESWELSGVEGNISVVENGFLAGNDLAELIEVYMCDLVGEKVYEKFGLQFPILIKIIDSREWLSIQVHPDDDLAMKRYKANGCLSGRQGKSEMWYVLQADENAQLINGFNKELDKKIYLENFNNGTLKEILNVENVKSGDVFYIPAGRVHALGPGICLAEIQQTSDTTYRIYDWDRVDENGKSRELHIEQALAAIDFRHYDDYKTDGTFIINQSTNLVKSPYFTTNIIAIDRPLERDYHSLDSFVIYLCTEGKFTIEYNHGKEPVKKGDTILIPAELTDIKLIPDNTAKMLEVFIEIE